MVKRRSLPYLRQGSTLSGHTGSETEPRTFTAEKRFGLRKHSEMSISLPSMIFDSRMAQYATLKEAFELILWRSYDSGMNGGISVVFFGPELPGKKQAMADNGTIFPKNLHDNGLLPLTNHQVYRSFYQIKLVDVEVNNKLTGIKKLKKKRQYEMIPGPVVRNVKEKTIEVI